VNFPTQAKTGREWATRRDTLADTSKSPGLDLTLIVRWDILLMSRECLPVY
jgi:hypothetical protein